MPNKSKKIRQKLKIKDMFEFYIDKYKANEYIKEILNQLKER